MRYFCLIDQPYFTSAVGHMAGVNCRNTDKVSTKNYLYMHVIVGSFRLGLLSRVEINMQILLKHQEENQWRYSLFYCTEAVV